MGDAMESPGPKAQEGLCGTGVSKGRLLGTATHRKLGAEFLEIRPY